MWDFAKVISQLENKLCQKIRLIYKKRGVLFTLEELIILLSTKRNIFDSTKIKQKQN